MRAKGHLNMYEREKIYLCLEQRLSIRDIGRKIGRNHSVILRELARNRRPNRGYSPFIANRLAIKRRTEANKVNPLKHSRILRFVKDKLQESWSPEQIDKITPLGCFVPAHRDGLLQS